MHLEIFLILNKTKIILIVNKSEQTNTITESFKMMQMSFIASKLYQKKVETLVH